MVDTAAQLVDRVLPEVAIRQWVLTLPSPLRYRCAYDASLGPFYGVWVASAVRTTRRVLDRPSAARSPTPQASIHPWPGSGRARTE